MMNKYRRDIDVLKGISIIAVVLYHLGIMNSGYLGVDVFLVINGYLVIPSILKKIQKDEFKYFEFLLKKYFRFIVLIAILIISCLIIGIVGMLPDDLENLAQSSIASCLFSQNILSFLTTKNYWNVVNEYKPLMHLWYVGILMQFYIIFPIIIYFFEYINKKVFKKDFLNKELIIICLISFGMFAVPFFSNNSKFYIVFFRLWEILIGGIIGLKLIKEYEIKKNNLLSIFIFLLLIFMLNIAAVNTNYSNIWENRVIPIGSRNTYNSNLIISNSMAVFFVVLLTSVILYLDNQLINNKILEFIGKMSYSIFIFHQPIIAYYRYFVKYEISILCGIFYFIIVFIISIFTYIFIEKKLKYSKKNLYISLVAIVIILFISMYLYIHAGVVRDVPELNVYKNNIHVNMHAEYVDRVFKYDKEFEENDKINVLVIGNSFARDFANVLLESNISLNINLSYIYSLDEKYIERLRKSNYIFYFGFKTDLPQYVTENCDSNYLYGIGTKNFGENNGIIYTKRFSKDYFSQTITLNNSYVRLNNEFKNEWKENYIDMITCIETKNNVIPIFTDDNKFISQDCHHLTEAGAKYYAQKIKFDFMMDGMDNQK